MNDDRRERGAAAMSDWLRVLFRNLSYGELVENYLDAGGGDPEDARATRVDMLADIGHWLGGDGKGFTEACELSGFLSGLEPHAGESDRIVAARFIAAVRSDLVRIGENPSSAISMASFHIAEELEEKKQGQMDMAGQGMS